MGPLTKQLPTVLAVLLLLLMAVLAGGAARRESITVDEVPHLGAGVSYLQKLDLRMNEEHPPLAKALAALPLVLRGVHTDYSSLPWTFSAGWFQSVLGEWVWGYYVALQWNDPYTTLWWARIPMLLLTLALGWCVYVYASRLGNAWGGVLCLALYVSTPVFLVFGPLVITDIPVTFFSLLTLWSFATLWRSPSRRALVIFGLAFGAALLTKFSAGLLLFAFLAFRLALRVWPLAQMPIDAAELREWRRLRGRYLWKGILIGALVVYGVYSVLSWHQPTDSLQILGHGAASLVLRRLLMPPWIFLRGLAMFVLTSPRPTFILGHAYPRGVWFYFPVLFVLKSTLAFLLLLALSMPVAAIARRKLKDAQIVSPAMEFHWRAVWTFLLVFLTACLLSPMSISIRHFTIPILLFILLLAPLPRGLALLAENGWRTARLVMGGVAVLALASIVVVLRAYPFYFPFLNSLSLGRPGYALVNDSNLDWNQGLLEANQFVQQHGLQQVLLDEYGFIEPALYIPGARFWNCQLPSPSDAGQWAIVSAGLIEDGHNCLWLLNYPHTAIGRGSMYAFQLPAVIPSVGDPAGPPPPELQRNFAGMPGPDSRPFFLNCMRDPRQMAPMMDHWRAVYEEELAKRKAEREKRKKLAR